MPPSLLAPGALPATAGSPQLLPPRPGPLPSSHGALPSARTLAIQSRIHPAPVWLHLNQLGQPTNKRVLVKTWGGGNPRALLGALQIGAATVENIMERPHNIKDRAT